MNYTQWFAQNGKFQKHEQWLVENLMLETIVGSHAYGCQTEQSDYDITAIVLPKHEHLYPQKYGFILGFDNVPEFRRKEMKGKKTMIGDKPFEAEWISLIEFFVHAGLKGSPNLIECLFVKRELVTVGTKMGWYLRDNRRLFISMKTFHAFKGYANGQMHRIRQRNPETDERKALIEKYGYDCYIDRTEFLTENGWKFFKDIKMNEKIATVNKSYGVLEFQKPLNKIIKKGPQKIYEIENNFTKFAVTKNHNILNSPCHRSKSLKYAEKNSSWNLTPIKILDESKRSWYHLRTSVKNENKFLGLYSKDFLILIGLYLAEGSICLRNGKVKSLHIVQTKEGKKEVFDFMRRIKETYSFKEYTYKKICSFADKEIEETIWVTHKKNNINFIYKNFDKARFKKYPKWITSLSIEEARNLRYGMFLGDGSFKKTYQQEIYYSTNKKLSDLYQILSMLVGYDTNVMGPYSRIYKKEKRLMYQVLVTRKPSIPKAICINTSGITHAKNLKIRGGKTYDYTGNVVCFEVSNGTLITRLDGKIAIQGNCKMAYHTLRLLDQLDQILTVNDIDLMRNKEECKLMRKGEWGDFDRFDKEFQRRMDHVSDLATKCNLPQVPQTGSLKKILSEILEEHFGDDTKIVQNDEYISAKDINDKFNLILNILENKK